MNIYYDVFLKIHNENHTKTWETTIFIKSEHRTMHNRHCLMRNNKKNRYYSIFMTLFIFIKLLLTTMKAGSYCLL